MGGMDGQMGWRDGRMNVTEGWMGWAGWMDGQMD